MQNIFTYENMIEKIDKIDATKEQIIAFVYAPYNEERISKIIDQFYDWWNIKFEDSILHFFWLGYIEASDEKALRWKVKSHAKGNIYYDMKIFSNLANDLNKHWKFKYRDRFEIILIRRYKNHNYFNKQIRVDLEKVFSATDDIKNIMIQMNEVINEYKTFLALRVELKNRKMVKKLVKVPIDLFLQLVPEKIY